MKQLNSVVVVALLFGGLVCNSLAEDVQKRLSDAQNRKASAQAQLNDLEQGISARQQIVDREKEKLKAAQAQLDRPGNEAGEMVELMRYIRDAKLQLPEQERQLAELRKTRMRYQQEVAYAEEKIRDLTALINQNTPKAQRVWRCNFKHALHNDPSECGHPELGGRWIDAQ